MKCTINWTFSIMILLLIFGVSGVLGSAEPFFFEDNVDEIVPFDAYFNSEPEKVKRERLSFLVKTMADNPDQVAYIVSYGNLQTIDCEAIDNLKMAYAFIQKEKKIPSKRVVYINGGYRTRGMTEFYLVPTGASFPVPNFNLNDVLNSVGERQ